MERIYLDHSATTPLREEVLDSMLPYLRVQFGNAGSVHRFGRECKRAVDIAREQVAELIHADPREITFTSGGTEADNLAVAGLCAANQQTKKRLIISAIEHHAVLHAADRLAETTEVDLSIVGVDSNGRVDPAAIESMLDDNTVLVSIMHANNETGTLQPIDDIGALCRGRNISFHSDTVQSVGKIRIDVKNQPIDSLSISAHKIYGPKGVGAFYCNRSLTFCPQAIGGAQEKGRRAGTENVAGIVGLGRACELARIELDENARCLGALRDRLESGIRRAVLDCWTNGSVHHRLSNILNVGFQGLEGEAILFGLDAEGIAVSTGSACTSGSLDPSHVLLAMGQDHRKAQSAIRLSLGQENTPDQIDRVVSVLAGVVERLRAALP